MKASRDLGTGSATGTDKRLRSSSGGNQRCESAADEEGVAMLFLTSGERVRIQAQAALVRSLAGAFTPSSLNWLRIGLGRAIDEQLTREGRPTTPNLLVLGSAGDWLSTIHQARSDYDSVPILAVAAAARQTELLALRAGADGFCGLPVDHELFEARARALLRRASTQTRQLASEVVELDESERALRCGGVVAQLSSGELAIVRRLYQHKECWVSNDLLWKALERGPSGYDSSLVRTYVMSVRKKLGPQRWILQTERGKGMMLTTSVTYRATSRELEKMRRGPLISEWQQRR
jgi:DNA-binding response OmpR family regulator